jgi:hypothetical protein
MNRFDSIWNDLQVHRTVSEVYRGFRGGYQTVHIRKKTLCQQTRAWRDTHRSDKEGTPDISDGTTSLEFERNIKHERRFGLYNHAKRPP